ncbi:MAG: RHS repeat-associated core domain-containing protein [Candidatus Kapaibacterium sp.]|nr:MAG: RHS repeat-associated core domain-containing protein [Candidatus Kapabacteria bacterium]
MGNTLERKNIRPFGSVLTTTGTGQRTGYIGREADNETGLGNYGVRLYEPEYGRFMSVDVLWGAMGDWNPYHYSHASPIVRKDGSGFADFFDQDGKKVGTDGVNDDKRYISSREFYAALGKAELDYNYLIESQMALLVPSMETLNAIERHVIFQATNPIQNDREHGGIVGTDGVFYPSSPGGRYSETGRAEMSLSESYRLMEMSGVSAALKVHSHPNLNINPFRLKSSLIFDPNPSNIDIDGAVDAPGIVLYPENYSRTNVLFYNSFGEQFKTSFQVLMGIATGKDSK